MKFIQTVRGKKVLSLFGMNIRVSKLCAFFTALAARHCQNRAWNTSAPTAAGMLVVFVVPRIPLIGAGIMSIYSLCQATRKILPDAVCILVSEPGFLTHFRNRLFRNAEAVFRWGQLMDVLRGYRGRVLLHIPEYMSRYFVKRLSARHRKILRTLPNLHANILNQNMQLMPSPEQASLLFSLTPQVTQTLAFKRNLTRDLADMYRMPVHLFSVHIDTSQYKPVPFAEKKKIIAYSPDQCPEKQQVLEQLRAALPDFKLHLIRGLSFDEYMNLIARSFFVLSFGEGFDSYFQQPLAVGSLGLAVYNDTFFPSPSWKELPHVFNSWEDLAKNAPPLIRSLAESPTTYYERIAETKTRQAEVYKQSAYMDNLRDFYAGRYHIAY